MHVDIGVDTNNHGFALDLNLRWLIPVCCGNDQRLTRGTELRVLHWDGDDEMSVFNFGIHVICLLL